MPAVGVDISDFSVKFIEFIPQGRGLVVGRYGEKRVPEDIVVSGSIRNPDALRAILAGLREEHGLDFIRGSLPEERGYLFETSVPAAAAGELRGALEFKLEENVPLKPTASVFDYDIIQHEGDRKSQTVDVVVSAFAVPDVQSYVDLFTDAGLSLVSLEIEAQAIARAVVPKGDLSTFLVVDFGRARSGISVVSGGVVRFTATIGVGGDAMTAALQKTHPEMTPDKILEFKNTVGIRGGKSSASAPAVMETVEALRSEMEKHVLYWQTHDATGADALPARKPVERVLLCGGNGNLAGLPEYLSRELRMSVERANVWVNTFDLNTYLPPITFNDSLGMASAIGLALHGES
jgi:type IV pilus assembly protein PilM